MNAKEFYNLAKEVRKAQRDYFKTGGKPELAIAKKLEKELDAEIRRVEAVLKEQNKNKK